MVQKVIYLDCFAGISGNMMLGALIDAGVPFEEFSAAIGQLAVKGYEISADVVEKCGVRAVYVNVQVTEEQPHRHLSDIVEIIDNSGFSDTVKNKSKFIFEKLAQAEAKVHGEDIEEVHFHEVGAVDAIVDVVGAVWCLEYLGIEKIYTSKLHVGGGFVECCHGTIPVPAPATAELLKGIPSYQKDIEKELVTPTGAALVSALASGYGNMPEGFVSSKISYGAGTWNLEIPNVLRLYFGEITQEELSKVWIIETNIDDLNPELYPHVIERLLDAGALDAWITPIIMKKGRPAAKLSVLTRGDNKEIISEIIFTETTAIGFRFFEAGRIELKREFLTVETPWGQVRVKVGIYQDMICNIAPEFEDCRKIAREAGIPLKIVHQMAVKEAMEI